MNYELQKGTVWRFPDRGNWSIHNGYYRGNWTPHIPRNVILKYSNEDDIVLDQFVGSGTTLIECALLNRKGIGIDISSDVILNNKRRLSKLRDIKHIPTFEQGDARDLKVINNTSIDLICTHPPYSNIIRYSTLKDDLSNLSYAKFLTEFDLVCKEAFRVLKENKIFAFMIADIRKSGKIYPLGFKTLEIALSNHFELKEIIIKEQFNCKSTHKWKEIAEANNFQLLSHEYLFIFKKVPDILV